VEVTPVSFRELSTLERTEKSELIRERVVTARRLQNSRYQETNGIHCNAQMRTKELRTLCAIDEAGQSLLKNAMEKLGLSARAYDRILKVARTIADLEASTKIET